MRLFSARSASSRPKARRFLIDVEMAIGKHLDRYTTGD
jgi:hypothetical protein